MCFIFGKHYILMYLYSIEIRDGTLQRWLNFALNFSTLEMYPGLYLFTWQSNQRTEKNGLNRLSLWWLAIIDVLTNRQPSLTGSGETD